MKKLALVLSVTVCLLFVAAPVSAQAVKDPSPPQQFLIKASNMDYAEIQMGELALKNAQSDEVKKFAQMMVDDHTKHRKDLLEIFKDLKLAVVATMEKADKEAYNNLSKLKGADFDREYMKVQVQRHKDVLNYMQVNIKSDDAHVRDCATKTLKAVQDHLKHAEQIQKNLK